MLRCIEHLNKTKENWKCVSSVLTALGDLTCHGNRISQLCISGFRFTRGNLMSPGPDLIWPCPWCSGFSKSLVYQICSRFHCSVRSVLLHLTLTHQADLPPSWRSCLEITVILPFKSTYCLDWIPAAALFVCNLAPTLSKYFAKAFTQGHGDWAVILENLSLAGHKAFRVWREQELLMDYNNCVCSLVIEGEAVGFLIGHISNEICTPLATSFSYPLAVTEIGHLKALCDMWQPAIVLRNWPLTLPVFILADASSQPS